MKESLKKLEMFTFTATGPVPIYRFIAPLLRRRRLHFSFKCLFLLVSEIMFAHLRCKTSYSVFSLNHSNRCQLHQNVASVSHLLNDEKNKLDIPFASAKKGNFIQASPFLENGFEGDAFLKRNLQRILPKKV